jgi:flagellar hook-associated protein 2
MPAITSLGIGSGVDINTMVEQLVALERRPLAQLQSQARTLQTEVSSFGQLSSLFSSLQTAANRLTGSSLWTQSKATSSDEAVAQVVVGGGNAAAGSYAVSVDTLATSQTIVGASSLASASEAVGSGVMTLQTGRWEQPPLNFVPRVGRDPVSITVSNSDTLTTLRDKINAAGAGVTASIVTDSSGARLALRSTDTGAENGFRLAVADDDDGPPADGAGLSRFAYDPVAGGNGLELKQAAGNARASVNGIPVESASNDISGVVEGLTLRLRRAGATAEVSVSTDRDTVRTAVQDFATAYNNLSKAIADQTRFDPGSKVGGPLQGDSAATGLQRKLRSLVAAGSQASSTFRNLSDMGLAMQRDGTLSVDATKLNNAVANLPEIRKALAADDTDPQKDGIARRYADLAQQVLGVDGSLTTRTESLRKRISVNSDNQAALQDRVDRFRARLVAQYSAMDANQAKLNALSGYVTQQLTALSGGNGQQR